MRFTPGIMTKYIDCDPTASMTNNPPSMTAAACSRFRGKLIGPFRFFLSRGIYRQKGGVRRWTRRRHPLVA
jgi:hypothetical protein